MFFDPRKYFDKEICVINEIGEITRTKKGNIIIKVCRERKCNFADKGDGSPYFKINKDGKEARLRFNNPRVVNHYKDSNKQLELDDRILKNVNKILTTVDKATGKTYWDLTIEGFNEKNDTNTAKNYATYNKDSESFPNSFVPLDAKFEPYKMAKLDKK